MNNLSAGSRSVWMPTAFPQFPALQEKIETEVCVIGGGIAGLTTAYLLSREGKTVVLIDAAEIGKGETGRTTAHFFPPDDRYFEIEDAFGADKARLVAESFQQATALVETIVKEEGINCEFERLNGYLFSLSPDVMPIWIKNLRQLARRVSRSTKKTKYPAWVLTRAHVSNFAIRHSFIHSNI